MNHSKQLYYDNIRLKQRYFQKDNRDLRIIVLKNNYMFLIELHKWLNPE